MGLEHALGGRHRIGLARIGLYRHAQCPRHGLERRLGDVMAVDPVDLIDMQRDPAMGAQRLKELADKLGVEGPDLGRGHLDRPHKIGPPRQVERGAHLRIVHRQMTLAIAADPALVAQRLRQRLTQRDAGILHRVVVVDMKVAGGAHGHVDQRMTRQLVQHVVEEPNAGLVVIDPGPVKIDLDRDIGFGRLAADLRLAHGSPRLIARCL